MQFGIDGNVALQQVVKPSISFSGDNKMRCANTWPATAIISSGVTMKKLLICWVGNPAAPMRQFWRLQIV